MKKNNKKAKVFISGKVSGDEDYLMKFKFAYCDLYSSYVWCKEHRQCRHQECPFYDRNFIYTCRIYKVFPRHLEVVNPTSYGFERYSWFVAMVKCIFILFGCEYVFMLKDWKSSKGAKIEHFFAKFFKKQIIYQKGGDK